MYRYLVNKIENEIENSVRSKMLHKSVGNKVSEIEIQIIDI